MNRESFYPLVATIWWCYHYVEDCVVEKLIVFAILYLSISTERKALEGLPHLLRYATIHLILQYFRDNAYLGLNLGNTLWPLLYGVVLSTRNTYEGTNHCVSTHDKGLFGSGLV